MCGGTAHPNLATEIVVFKQEESSDLELCKQLASKQTYHSCGQETAELCACLRLAHVSGQFPSSECFSSLPGVSPFGEQHSSIVLHKILRCTLKFLPTSFLLLQFLFSVLSVTVQPGETCFLFRKAGIFSCMTALTCCVLRL